MSIRVEHSTEPSPRSRMIANGRTFKQLPEAVAVSRAHRFHNNRLVAIAGVPVAGASPNADSEVYSSNTAGEITSHLVDCGYSLPSAWERHAAAIYLDGNDEALNCF